MGTAHEASDRLARISSGVSDAKLELRHQNQRARGGVVIAQITVRSGRAIARSEEGDPDALKAINLATEKIERQLRRLHERRADWHGPRAEPESPEEDVPGELEDGEEIVRTKRFPVKPIDALEAIEQMKLLGHDFFVFQNLDAGTISLAYRRRDGTYGLLIPEPM